MLRNASRSPRVITATMFVLALAACGDTPVEPAVPAFTHAGNHPADPGPQAAVTVTQQPIIAFFDATRCSITYAFKAKANVEVAWTTYWYGGEHDGIQIGSNTVRGSREVMPIAAHFNDGHSFDGLRIVISDGGDVLAEAFTEGRTVSC